MLSVSGTGDRHDRKMLNIDQNIDNCDSRFMLQILTADLTPQFENSRHRKVDLSIVDGLDFQSQEGAILIPLVVTGQSRIEGKTKTYYRQKYDSQGLTLSAQIQLDGYVIKDSSDSEVLSEPCLLVVMGIEVPQEESDLQIQGSQQGFSGTGYDQGQPYDRRQHVDKNENSNGGIDLPVGATKSDDEERRRVQEEIKADFQDA